MASLSPTDFDRFFREIHHVDPFPWQSQLARLVCERGEWPPALDIPTGAGKTAAIDIAVFQLALEADRQRERRAAVRIAFVVDRRLVVDDAHRRALLIAAGIQRANSALLANVRDRLCLLSETAERPLMVARLRGGLAREPDWVRTPSQPTVVVSTVDQIGSRLLFRGYGVSDQMKPIHAGLLGMDTLLLLDEAHLSQPFVQTVGALRGSSAVFPAAGSHLPGRPITAVTLSATQTAEKPYQLGREDLGHPTLQPRLRASKRAVLVKIAADSTSESFAAAFAEYARALSVIGQGDAQVVAVVVNRVRRARNVFEALQKVLDDAGKRAEIDLALLLGRTRPLDRNEVLRDLLPRMQSKRDPQAARPLFVIATQCIEAGADLDFDALVTEAAPLDCLRQRFGRLNRMGRNIEAKAAILAAADQISVRAEDPLYGTASALTWELLQKHAVTSGKGKNRQQEIDFGIEASRAWLPQGKELPPLLAPREDAPIVLPAYVELWSKTSPVPAVDPEPALFLHGPDAGPPEVSLVWRAELADDDEAKSEWKEWIQACPPSTLESASVPYWEAVRWLKRVATGDIPDVESGRGDSDGDNSLRKFDRALRWRGEDTPEPAAPWQVRPGDLLIVPASRGGLDRWGWNPVSGEPVVDRAREANCMQRGRDVLRLGPALLEMEMKDANSDEVRKRLAELDAFIASSVSASQTKLLADLQTAEWLPPSWRAFLDQHPRPTFVRAERDGRLLAISARVSEPSDEAAAGGEAATEDDETSLRARRRVKLSEHSRGVEAMAVTFARKLGLDDALSRDIALAAFLHDAGKAHPAFKQYLYGGDELAAIAGPALAKSGRSRLTARGSLPKGARHEAASIRLAVAHRRFEEAHNKDLVLWLIGTHHGYGRPFFPPVEWPLRGESFDVDLGDGLVRSKAGPQVEDPGQGWPDLFARLKRAYGPWKLAWLEAIVRLADHRRSEWEQLAEDSDA